MAIVKIDHIGNFVLQCQEIRKYNLKVLGAWESIPGAWVYNNISIY